jgi:hypothetical protein
MQAKKTQPFLQPAASVISKFGGARKLSDLMDLDKSTVCQWRVSKERGGTGGLIPARHHEPLLALAKKQGVRLGASDLVKRPPPRSLAFDQSMAAR